MEQDVNKKIARRLLRDAFVLLVIVGVMDLVALKLDFFWTLHYYDSVVHFLAGICVGLGTVWFAMSTTKTEMTRRRVFTVTLVGAVIVGIVWEIFEVTNGITFLADGIHYLTDTGSDLLMDVCGGLVAGWYAWKIVSKS
jgi:hypothetical protein